MEQLFGVVEMLLRRFAKTRAALIGLALGTTVLAGCSASGNETPPPEKDDARPEVPIEHPSATSYEPPRKFDASQAVPLPAEATRGRLTLMGDLLRPLPVLLHGTNAFIGATDSLQVMDATTGQLADIRPEHSPLSASTVTNSAEAPAISDTDEPFVVHPFLVKVTGSGTVPDSVSVEVVAVDATSARELWRTMIPFSNGTQGLHGFTAVAVGISADTVVIQVAGERTGAVYGLRLDDLQVEWSVPLTGAVMAGQTVVGLATDSPDREEYLSAFDASSGKELWTTPPRDGQSSAAPVGPGLVQWSGGPLSFRNSGRFNLLLDSETGKVRHDLEESSSTCRHDGQSTTVCHTSSKPTAVGFSHQGEVLWTLPDDAGTRVAPAVTAVWGGAVYGTVSGRPVVLDAASGADLEPDPGLAPIILNGYVALAWDSEQGLVAYRTAG